MLLHTWTHITLVDQTHVTLLHWLAVRLFACWEIIIIPIKISFARMTWSMFLGTRLPSYQRPETRTKSSKLSQFKSRDPHTCYIHCLFPVHSNPWDFVALSWPPSPIVLRFIQNHCSSYSAPHPAPYPIFSLPSPSLLLSPRPFSSLPPLPLLTLLCPCPP